MNFIVACAIAATVSLQTVKLGTAPGKTMVVTGATVSAASEISNVVTKAYVEGLGIEAGVSARAVTNIASSAALTNAGAVAVAADIGNSKLPLSGGTMTGTITFRRTVSSAMDGYINAGELRLNKTYRSGGAYRDRFFQITTRDTYNTEVPYVTWYDKQTGTTPPAIYNLRLPKESGYLCTVAAAAAMTNALPAWTKSADKPTYTAAEVGAASQAELTPIATDARTAYGYSRGTYLYMNANTNSWFAGTNYVFGADATNRTHFVWEAGMDAATVPCSMALYELRDGAKQCVWDQRDWTAWYWSFKAAQMNASIQAQMAASNAAIRAEIASTNNHAWAKWYAASGRVNPDPTTTYVDTPKVCLAPGMNWESVAEVSGCGYWTIVANGLVVGGSGTNAVLQIKDFEGNAIMTITKGAHRLAWLESEDFTGQMTDGNGWVCFDMMADSQPTGYFSTTLDASDFVVQTDANCPAQYRWENLGGGEWRVHFLLKPGVVSDRCFAKFMSEVQGETKITYAAGAEISGGLIYNGRKIAPVIPAGAVYGDTITWKVVE